MSTDLPPPRGATPPPLRPATFDESPLRALVARTRGWMRVAGLGRILFWLALAICAAIAIDLTTSLAPGPRAMIGGAILLVAAVLAVRHFWWQPGKVNTALATCQVEAAHPEIGQLLRTARDSSLTSAAISPVLKNELFRRASVQIAGLDLGKHLPRKPGKLWLAAGVAAVVGLMVFLSVNREAPTAFARLLAPFSGITYTQVENTTPDATFDRNRLPRVEAKVSGRHAKDVIVHVLNPEGGEVAFPMNPLGGGRYDVTLPASESSFAFRIEAGDSVPAEGTMECVDPAEFVSSSAELALPDYTGQPPVSQDSADIEAVEGSRATLHFKMSAPMASASLKLPGGTEIPLTVDGANLSATVELKVGGDVAELTGTDARGHSVEPTQFKHKGIADGMPMVEWIEPTKDIEATAVAEIPLRLRLRDDFGVASYGVVLQAQGESKEIMTRSVEARDLRDLSEMTAAALETFPLTIRDNVRLYAWATDHKPRDNARSVSKLRSVDIKPFKRKWRMIAAPSGPMIPMEDIEELDALVKTQREILSDAFPLLQGGAAPAGDALKELGDREAKLQQRASVIHAEVTEEGNWPADDLNLLAAAVSQMGESSNAWFALKGQLGFDRGDAALSTLLELRKNLMTLLMRSQSPSLKPKPEEVPNALTDLAAEAERLAREERDVSEQLASKPDENRLEAIRRQQNVANSDTGELHAKMMDHPESTPLVLEHMADAEKQVRAATRGTTSSDAISAAPPQLDDAANKLDEVAKHLRALDESLLDATLAEMANDAKKAAEEAEPKDEGEKPGEEPGDKPEEQAGNKPEEKPGDKPGEGDKEAQAAGDKPGEKPGDKPGEGEKGAQAGEKPGQGDKPGEKGQGKSPSDKPGQGEGKSPGEGQGEGKSDMAGKGKGQGKGAGQGQGEGEGQGQGSGEGQGQSPGDLAANGTEPGAGKGEGEGKSDPAANDPNAANMAGSGEKAGETPGGEGPAATPGKSEPKDAAEVRKEALAKAARQAATNDDVLRFFAERQTDPAQAERFEALRKDAATAELEQKLKDAAEGKTDGKQAAEDLKEFAAALEQERELRRQSRLESLAKNREKAAELKKEAEARRDAAREAAKELAAKNDGGFSFDIPKQALEDARGKGEGKGDQPGTGQGEDGARGSGSRSGKGYTPRDLARDIDKLKDTELSRIARELEKTAPQAADVKPLAEAERRLAAMIAEISGLARDDDSGNSIPPAFRRAVEDYYRALSDDFGDEEVAPR